MQFSLRHLILFTVLVAIGVSFSMQVIAIRSSAAKTAALEAQFKQQQRNEAFIIDQNANLNFANLRAKKQIDDHQHLRNQVATIFADTVAPESNIIPKTGFICLRAIPLLDQRNCFHKKFAISIPEDRKLQLTLGFSTEGGRTENRVAPLPDFQPTEKLSAPLRPGQHIVDFFFGSSSDDSKEQTNPLFVRVTIDGQTVLTTGFSHEESNGSSYSNYDYSQQKNYGAKAKLPRLIHFNPLPGKTYLNLVLEDVTQQ